MGISDPEFSARSLTELVDLILKLNSRIREKISPRRKEGKKPAKTTEMVIIILNNTSGAPAKAPRPEKLKASGSEWIEDLCDEIERGNSGPPDPISSPE